MLALQLLTALAMIGLVLIQHGKGADMGASFGSGASGSLFGASGSANFLSRSTAVCAAVFFACTLALAFIRNDGRAARAAAAAACSTARRRRPARRPRRRFRRAACPAQRAVRMPARRARAAPIPAAPASAGSRRSRVRGRMRPSLRQRARASA